MLYVLLMCVLLVNAQIDNSTAALALDCSICTKAQCGWLPFAKDVCKCQKDTTSKCSCGQPCFSAYDDAKKCSLLFEYQSNGKCPENMIDCDSSSKDIDQPTPGSTSTFIAKEPSATIVNSKDKISDNRVNETNSENGNTKKDNTGLQPWHIVLLLFVLALIVLLSLILAIKYCSHKPNSSKSFNIADNPLELEENVTFDQRQKQTLSAIPETSIAAHLSTSDEYYRPYDDTTHPVRSSSFAIQSENLKATPKAYGSSYIRCSNSLLRTSSNSIISSNSINSSSFSINDNPYKKRIIPRESVEF